MAGGTIDVEIFESTAIDVEGGGRPRLSESYASWPTRMSQGSSRIESVALASQGVLQVNAPFGPARAIRIRQLTDRGIAGGVIAGVAAVTVGIRQLRGKILRNGA